MEFSSSCLSGLGKHSYLLPVLLFSCRSKHYLYHQNLHGKKLLYVPENLLKNFLIKDVCFLHTHTQPHSRNLLFSKLSTISFRICVTFSLSPSTSLSDHELQWSKIKASLLSRSMPINNHSKVISLSFLILFPSLSLFFKTFSSLQAHQSALECFWKKKRDIVDFLQVRHQELVSSFH